MSNFDKEIKKLEDLGLKFEAWRKTKKCQTSPVSVNLAAAAVSLELFLSRNRKMSSTSRLADLSLVEKIPMEILPSEPALSPMTTVDFSERTFFPPHPPDPFFWSSFFS